MSAEPAPDRTAPRALWRIARAFLLTLHALFGAPEDVAERHTLTGAAHAFMASWLRCGEALLRHLLLIEAAAFAKPNTRPLLRAARPRKRTPHSFFADTPQDWRVSFRCFKSPMLRQAQHDAEYDAGGPVSVGLTPALIRRKATRPARISREERWDHTNFTPVTFRSAWPLAERYEALLRVFNTPEPYARRLAARLHATPHRARELTRTPPDAEHRIDRFARFTHGARQARRRFDSS